MLPKTHRKTGVKTVGNCCSLSCQYMTGCYEQPGGYCSKYPEGGTFKTPLYISKVENSFIRIKKCKRLNVDRLIDRIKPKNDIDTLEEALETLEVEQERGIIDFTKTINKLRSELKTLK